MSLVTRAQAAVKAWQFGGSGTNPTESTWGWFGTFANSRIDYAAEAGDLRLSSLVMVPLNKITTAFPEPPLHVLDKAGKPRPTATLPALWAQPNPYYDGSIMGQALVADWRLSGNAYLIGRPSTGTQYAKQPQVAELWYEPSFTIRPTWPRDGSAYLAAYEWFRDGRWQAIPPGFRVIHFRYGLDPNNLRLGISPLVSALRHVYVDNEVDAYIAALLRNAAVPPILISPKVGVTIADPEGFKALFMERFSGDNRGKPMVSNQGIDVQMLAYPPNALALGDSRLTPEERVSALLDVPAMYAGLGAGLARSTYSNYEEARKAFYDGNLIPTWRQFGAVITHQLAPYTAGWQAGDQAGFNLDKVRALQDDQDAKAARLNAAYLAGRITRAEARTGENYEARPQDEVYLIPSGTTVVDSNAPYLTPPPAAVAPAPLDTPAEGLPGTKAAPLPDTISPADWDAAAALWRTYAEEVPDAVDAPEGSSDANL